MKTQLIFPVATAILGFAAGWLLKPSAPAVTASATERPDRPERPAPPRVETAPPAEPRPTVPTEKGGASLENHTASSGDVHSRDDAKLARLVEALNLNPEQKQALIDAIARAEEIFTADAKHDPSRMLAAALEAAASIEKALAAVLTPEQTAAWNSLRERARENTVENTAQNRVSDLSKITDLSPEQREKILGLTRDALTASHQARPAGIDLMTDGSVLPLGSTFIAETSVDRMIFNSTQPDPAAADVAFTEYQSKNLDAELERYRPLLTPAQLSRLEVEIAERKKAIETVRGFLR